MKVQSTPLPGVMIIDTDVFPDERGFFLETYQARRYAELGIDARFVQNNHSRSGYGVLRGLHFQKRQPQGKLVRAVRGAIWDVAVDFDPRSETFTQWVGVELSDRNHRQLYVPPGYAHGFVVISDIADVEYLCTDYYLAGDDHGIIWNDPTLAIDWPVPEPVLSEKDRVLPTLAALTASSA